MDPTTVTLTTTTISESLQSSVPIKMFFSNISLFFCILLNVKLNTVFIIMKYLIIAKKHPDELMSKSTNVRLSFYIFMQKMHFFGTLFWVKKHEVYKPAKKLCYCHLGSSKIPFLLQKFNFLLASCIIGYIFASQFATYAILIFFPSLLIFFQHIPFLNLIHSKELTLTSSSTRPLLGDNRVLCAIF